jgi:23S rRNA (cytidine1920-2'-O)/16S rRNA (cytidine1409-2'-O)-methyltransferase
VAKKKHAADLMLDSGLFDTRKEAEAWILEGKVYASGQRVTGAGQQFPEDTAFTAKGREARYAGKGGLKLEGAIREFALDITGSVCVDAGASTGGFTSCLLRHGAALVYAVDAGFGQLAGSLRQDARVVNLERTNISDTSLLSLSPVPVLGTVDLSYLSLLKAIPAFSAILRGAGSLICLVKPLFEVDDVRARRTGLLAHDAYIPLLTRLTEAINGMPGAACAGVCASPVTGNAGTREFFILVRLGGSAPPPDLGAQITQSVRVSETLGVFRKD